MSVIGYLIPLGYSTLYFIFAAPFTVIRDFATVIGEEIGWCRFLAPVLAKNHGLPATAMITGSIWAFSRRRSGNVLWPVNRPIDNAESICFLA